MNDIDTTPILTFDDPPADHYITTDDWDSARHMIAETLRTCDYKEASEFFLKRGFPFLRWFEISIEHRLIKAGFGGGKHSSKPEIEAAFLTLQSIKDLRELLAKNGSVNIDSVKVYLRSFELAINVLRAGLLPKLAGIGESTSKKEKKRRSMRQTWNGQTHDQLLERNQKIIKHFLKPRKAPLSMSRFAQKHAAEYGLKPRSIRNILSKAVGSLPG